MHDDLVYYLYWNNKQNIITVICVIAFMHNIAQEK